MSNINPVYPVYGTPTTQSVRDNFAAAASEIDGITSQLSSVSQVANAALPLAGGTMTGAITLAGDPASALQPATKQYVDSSVILPAVNTPFPDIAGGAIGLSPRYAREDHRHMTDPTLLPLAGGTMTGLLTLSGAPTANLHAATKQYVDTAAYLKLSGGTVTGAITLPGDPTTALQAATKQYVDVHVGGLPLSGGTLTGPLLMGSTPAAIPADASYPAILALQELCIDNPASATGHIGLNSFIGTTPSVAWRYRKAGYAGQVWQDTAGKFQVAVYASGAANAQLPAAVGTLTLDQTGMLTTSGKLQANGGSIIAYQASGNATVTCWSASGGYAMGMWCGSSVLNFGNTDGAGVPNQQRMALDGSSNLLVNGAVYPVYTATGGLFYLTGDASTSRLVNFHTNYYLQLQLANGFFRFVSNGAETWHVEPGGITRQPGQAWMSECVANTSVYPAYGTSNAFRILADVNNNYVQWLSSWNLYVAVASGQMIYQRAGAIWCVWRAGDAVIYNNVANMGGIGPYADYSDARGKRDIEDDTRGLDVITKLRPVMFQRLRRDLPPDGVERGDIMVPDIIPRRELGFVAQDVQAVLPEAVLPFEDIDSDDPGLAITTTPIVAAMVNAIKELEARVRALES